MPQLRQEGASCQKAGLQPAPHANVRHCNSSRPGHQASWRYHDGAAHGDGTTGSKDGEAHGDGTMGSRDGEARGDGTTCNRGGAAHGDGTTSTRDGEQHGHEISRANPRNTRTTLCTPQHIRSQKSPSTSRTKIRHTRCRRPYERKFLANYKLPPAYEHAN
jgi:hypothetical protein